MKSIKTLTLMIEDPLIEEKIREEQIALFIKAMLKTDLSLLEKVLHEEFLYFEDKTKAEHLTLLKPIFANTMEHDFIEKLPVKKRYRSAFCGSCYGGAIMLFFFNIVKRPFPSYPENLVPKGIALQFDEGLISELKACTSMMGEKTIKG